MSQQRLFDRYGSIEPERWVETKLSREKQHPSVSIQQKWCLTYFMNSAEGAVVMASLCHVNVTGCAEKNVYSARSM